MRASDDLASRDQLLQIASDFENTLRSLR
jgi:hypothetical protein